MPSIVIPAHDEAARIGGLLRALQPLAQAGTEVVVVCNGCTDGTAGLARAAAGWATVLDLPTAGKPAALQAGDDAATSFPRAYLDADVVVQAGSLQLLFDAVGPQLPAVAATPEYDLTRSGALVRSHYAIWTRLPANGTGLAGTNLMVVSRQGRQRFDRWPALIGDDYFLDGLFGPQEKRRVARARVLRPAPAGVWSCVSRKARIQQGNLDVQRAGLRPKHPGGGLGAALGVVRAQPALAVHLPAHVLITVWARLLTLWRQRRGTSQVWYRDDSRDPA